MLASLAAPVSHVIAVLVMSLALTTVPAMLALGVAALVGAAVLVGRALRQPEPKPVPVRARPRR
jgi:hypothetical protein